MSDEESVPSFLEDVRVKFVENKVCGLLTLESQTWRTSAVGEDFQKLLEDFFETEAVVYFSSPNKVVLVASKEVPPDAQNKVLYIHKKRKDVPISCENYRTTLLFGLLSLPPLPQLSRVIEQVCAPLLTHDQNHHTWPNVIRNDVARHIESICSKTSVVQGQILGETVLPMPTAASWKEKAHDHFRMHNNKDRALAHCIETQVINWSHLIQKKLKEDSADFMKTGCKPGPSAELKFWASRRSNLESICHQLHSPVVEMMESMLEVMDSSYHPTIKILIGNVSNALIEAQDIDLYLQPLNEQLSQLENKGFVHMEKYIPALFHTAFLIWTNCQYYQKPARIVVLLQELCNLLIEQASAYLSADLLLRHDPEESLQMVKRVIKALSVFKQCYQTQKERLANQDKSTPWDFPAAMIFSHFSQFFRRMLQLEVRSHLVVTSS
ncbi:axonemal-like [Nothobranchius furzeri]|uniref:Axonemal-like n=1 Tax=Nothobranchius furzeri TaxID=105023 RepID=A0A9D2YST1_NOTFU|nr:axonemal-like [Nothobranchius furzeri]